MASTTNKLFGCIKNFLTANVDSMALSCLGISASGWLTFIIAFGSQLISLDPIINAAAFLFVPWYLAAVVGPIMYVVIGLHLLLKNYFRFARIFKSASFFLGIFYIGVLAAPLFFIITLFASSSAGIGDAIDQLNIPSLRDAVDLGPFNFLSSGIDRLFDFLREFVRGLLYFLLVIFFDQFISGVKGQLIGGFTSFFFLGLSMMMWPFIKREREDPKKMC